MNFSRTKSIRWKFVLWNYLEVLLIIFYMAFICKRFFYPIYGKHGVKPMRREELFVNIINTSMPGILFFLCGFYCLLHAWLNACAEVLRFADRLFYKVNNKMTNLFFLIRLIYNLNNYHTIYMYFIFRIGGIHHLIVFITGHGTSLCTIGFTPTYTKMWLKS